MKMFSECSGECCLCCMGSFCVAGHGDDEFSPASKEKIIERLDKGEYPSYTDMMKSHLLNVYDYDYDKEGREVGSLKQVTDIISDSDSNEPKTIKLGDLTIVYV